ncbi:uncharacterized protein [Fopius arisanus]|uniref:Uncharacterized protein n=1 Tax=Fopius arisanus TaxID=64838 RepID=A0A0C9R1U4_9HYME|nr:PREDICTED: uncharacterized protein LOC105269080 [Fopius arisanus]
MGNHKVNEDKPTTSKGEVGHSLQNYRPHQPDTENSDSDRKENQRIHRKKRKCPHEHKKTIPKVLRTSPPPEKDFTSEDENLMLNYLISTNSVDHALCISIWLSLEQKGILPHRAWSLFVHFFSSMLPTYKRYKVPKRVSHKLKRLREIQKGYATASDSDLSSSSSSESNGHQEEESKSLPLPLTDIRTEISSSSGENSPAPDRTIPGINDPLVKTERKSECKRSGEDSPRIESKVLRKYERVSPNSQIDDALNFPLVCSPGSEKFKPMLRACLSPVHSSQEEISDSQIIPETPPRRCKGTTNAICVLELSGLQVRREEIFHEEMDMSDEHSTLQDPLEGAGEFQGPPRDELTLHKKSTPGGYHPYASECTSGSGGSNGAENSKIPGHASDDSPLFRPYRKKKRILNSPGSPVTPERTKTQKSQKQLVGNNPNDSPAIIDLVSPEFPPVNETNNERETTKEKSSPRNSKRIRRSISVESSSPDVLEQLEGDSSGRNRGKKIKTKGGESWRASHRPPANSMSSIPQRDTFVKRKVEKFLDIDSEDSDEGNEGEKSLENNTRGPNAETSTSRGKGPEFSKGRREQTLQVASYEDIAEEQWRKANDWMEPRLAIMENRNEPGGKNSLRNRPVNPRSARPPRYFRSPVRRKPFTLDEDRAMIQALIDYDMIHKGTALRAWEELQRIGVPELSHHSAKSLTNHYANILRWNYRDHTDDPTAIAKFQAAVGKRLKKLQNAK